MRRFLAGLIIAGVMMIMGGIDGILNSRKYPFSPTPVEMSKLEQAKMPPDTWHLKISNAVPLTWLGIPATIGVADQAPSGPHGRIIFPIASESHPYVAALQSEKASSAGSSSSEHRPDPSAAHYALFVRSTQFPATQSPPSELRSINELSGVIINDIDGIPSKDIDAIRSQFRLDSQHQVLVLEHGKRSPSLLESIVMLVLGPGMFVLAFILVKGRNRDD